MNNIKCALKFNRKLNYYSKKKLKCHKTSKVLKNFIKSASCVDNKVKLMIKLLTKTDVDYARY